MTLITHPFTVNRQPPTSLLVRIMLLLGAFFGKDSSVSGFSVTAWSSATTTCRPTTTTVASPAATTTTAFCFGSLSSCPRRRGQHHSTTTVAATTRTWFGTTTTTRLPRTVLHSSSSNGGEGPADQDGADLAAAFFKAAQAKGIDREELLQLEEFEDIDDDDEDEDEDEDDEDVSNSPPPQPPGMAMSDASRSLTDDKIYSEVKERVLDTAGGFVDFVKRAQDDDEEDENDDDDDKDDQLSSMTSSGADKPYVPPTTVPDSELTAGEVIIVVLDALLHNDVPTKNRGVEIFFGYSSAGSQVKTEVGLTPDEYAEFLKETEYKVLFDHQSVAIDKADYSFDGKKAFFTARLQKTGAGGAGPLDVVSVNFILSTKGGAQDDDACWLIDSMLIRPESMRRRRRR